MIRIAAVDDDSIFLQELKDIISLQIDNHQYPYKLDLYNDSEIFLECLLKTPYDLVFLDMAFLSQKNCLLKISILQ